MYELLYIYITIIYYYILLDILYKLSIIFICDHNRNVDTYPMLLHVII